VLLIQELSKKKNLRRVIVQRGDLTLRLERRGWQSLERAG
jgi:hypothetical protein